MSSNLQKLLAEIFVILLINCSSVDNAYTQLLHPWIDLIDDELTPIVREYNFDAEVTLETDAYIVKYDTMKFTVHEMDEEGRFLRKWLFDPAKLDCMVLSHAHIDHSGRIPQLVKDGFKGNIFCTKATRDLAQMMLEDSARIQESDARYSNKRRRKLGEPEDVKPIYVAADAKNCMKNFIGIDYDKWHKINDKVSVVFKDDGHIFGSANITLKIKEGVQETCVGFSGDIGRPQRPILKDPQKMEDLDYLLCESTYGGIISWSNFLLD